MSDYSNTSLEALEERYLRSTIPRFAMGVLAGLVAEPLLESRTCTRPALEMLVRQLPVVATFCGAATGLEQLALGAKGAFDRGAALTAGTYVGAAMYQMIRRHAL